MSFLRSIGKADVQLHRLRPSAFYDKGCDYVGGANLAAGQGSSSGQAFNLYVVFQGSDVFEYERPISRDVDGQTKDWAHTKDTIFGDHDGASADGHFIRCHEAHAEIRHVQRLRRRRVENDF